ncbi:MAG: hypothetical protein IJ620_02865 [Bacteroidales bacterium]|nr:hypothetical protein [Bacteroidales bacterium]
MTNHDLMQLLKEGKIDEAHTHALADYEQQADDSARLNLALAKAALCGQQAEAGDYEGFAEQLRGLSDIKALPIVRISNTLCWSFLKMANRMSGSPEEMALRCDSMGHYAMQLNPERPSQNASILCKAMLVLRKKHGWSHFATFMDWFGWDAFRLEDYQCEEMSERRRMPVSLVESAYAAYARDLLHRGNQEAIATFLPRMEAMSEQHPEMTWVAYYTGKLLIALGNLNDDTRRRVKAFVKRKNRDFWAWDMLADVAGDDELRMACYCKALTCPSEELMKRNVHIKLARLLHAKGMDSEAKAEYRAIMAALRAGGYTAPQYLVEIAAEEWYQHAAAPDNNRQFYYTLVPKAEAFLYAGIEEQDLFITYINTEKRTARYVTKNHQEGFLHTTHLNRGRGVALYHVYRCRMEHDGQRTQVYTCTEMTDMAPYEGIFIRRETGVLKTLATGTAFVNGIFVTKALAEPYDNGTHVAVKAILNYNKIKQEWSWRALKLAPVESSATDRQQ